MILCQLSDSSFRNITILSFALIALFGVVSVLGQSTSNNKFFDLYDFGRVNPYKEFNLMLNKAFFEFFKLQPAVEWINKNVPSEDGAYYAQTYLRDLIAGTFVYWTTAGIWSFVIYIVLRDPIFTKKGRNLPTWETFLDQMMVAQSSLFLYACVPLLSEFFIESGYTFTYFYVDEIGGWGPYFLYLFLYFVWFEFGIYWVHRTLHTNKFLYKYVHGLHHKYNHADTMTPWCSIAFNPVDGMLQASPYVVGLFLLPVHYFTHIFLLFFSGVWATNIHDSMWGDTEPIMGSKYHTLHHTHYIYNYGQFFIFFDWLYGTFREPKKTKFD